MDLETLKIKQEKRKQDWIDRDGTWEDPLGDAISDLDWAIKLLSEIRLEVFGNVWDVHGKVSHIQILLVKEQP